MNQMNCMRIPLNRGWKFFYGEPKRFNRIDHETCYNITKTGQEYGVEAVFLNENAWLDVSIPHDWNTLQPASPEHHPSNGFKPRDTGWYYKIFDLPDIGEDACVRIDFEGVMGECVVYVNGVLCVRNESGYTGFGADITDYILPGEKNMVVVSVDNTRWEGWWYEGAGIYRPVTVSILPPLHFAPLETFILPEKLSDNTWKVSITGKLENTTGAPADAWVESTILDPNGNVVGISCAKGDCAAYNTVETSAFCTIDNPRLWSPDVPILYHLVNRLKTPEATLQEEEIAFGFRNIEFTADRGMLLNGKPLMVKGICCHQDHAGVGIAVTQSLIRYRIQKMKAMGVNAYRCAHHCPSESLLNICDELGMLVKVENRHFRSSDEVMAQLDYLIKMSRNHPCVFLYSLFNEEPWQEEKRGRKIAERLQRRVHSLDSSRAVTAAMNGGVLAQDNAADVLDVAGINYFIDDYMKYAERRPGHPMIATENGPIYATRGVFKNDFEKQQCASYGDITAHYGQLLEPTMARVQEAPHVAGVFVWGGFDYRGEPQPFEWPSVFSHWGFCDNCGFEKASFYRLKTYYTETPMLYLCPHWNWTPGEEVRVVAYTTLKKATLFVNGAAQETKNVQDFCAEWTLPFEAGEIRVVAEDGAHQMAETVRTAGSPSRLCIEDATPKKDPDSVILNISLTDSDNRLVPTLDTDRIVKLKVTGGRIIGVGNGDPNGLQPDIAETISTFAGRCQVIIEPEGDRELFVRASTDGAQSAEFRLAARTL